jgi:hypothetical protein
VGTPHTAFQATNIDKLSSDKLTMNCNTVLRKTFGLVAKKLKAGFKKCRTATYY